MPGNRLCSLKPWPGSRTGCVKRRGELRDLMEQAADSLARLMLEAWPPCCPPCARAMAKRKSRP